MCKELLTYIFIYLFIYVRVCVSSHIVRQKLEHFSVFRKVFRIYRGISKFQFF
jgi:hypothetical protein